MSFDAVDCYVQYEKAYARERGYVVGTDGRRYPVVTWGDAMTFYLAFMKATDTAKTCLGEKVPVKLPTSVEVTTAITGGGAMPAVVKWLVSTERCVNYLASDRFKAAKAAFAAMSPLEKAYSVAGITAPMYVLARINEPYPYAQDFWKAARVYAIARAAAGEVKGNVDLAVEALDEAVRALPSTVGAALTAALPGLPTLDKIATILKWTAIGALGLIGWWYLSPRLRRK